jgi:hypothetical protein
LILSKAIPPEAVVSESISTLVDSLHENHRIGSTRGTVRLWQQVANVQTASI